MLEAKEISAVLGGPKVLGQTVKDSLAMSNLIIQGLPVKAAMVLKQRLNIPVESYFAAIGISKKQFERYTEDDHLPIKIGDQVFRLAKIYKLAMEVFEDNSTSAITWLREPQPGLSNEPPLSLLRTEVGAREVEELLYRIEYGMLA